MRKYKKVKVEYEREEIISKVCDLCGKEFKVWDSDSWSDTAGVISETHLSIKEGSDFRCEGYYTLITIDICPDCFKTKLIPWLVEEGVKIQRTEIDY